jgi:hypothetical protein
VFADIGTKDYQGENGRKSDFMHANNVEAKHHDNHAPKGQQ